MHYCGSKYYLLLIFLQNVGFGDGASLELCGGRGTIFRKF